MAFSWFVGNKQETPDTETKNSNDEKYDVDLQWFDDIVEGSASTKGDTQILSKIWDQITGENMISRIISPSQQKAGKIWSKLCHRCDISYPKYNTLSVVDVFDEKNIREINLIRYAIRHSCCAYPPSWVVLLGCYENDITKAFQSTKTLISTVFNMDRDKDIIIDNCSNNLIIPNKLHQPSFYLCVDHKKHKIVIAIRGSSSIADALTDINAVAKEYKAFNICGYVHEGIMASARFVFDKVTKDLVLTCNKYKDYQLIITGHSLGAGCAALLGFMYNNHPIICTQNKLKVFAFASPCVISKEFTEKNVGNEYITSIALSTDCITRLSLQSVKQSNYRLDEIMKCSNMVIRECMVQLEDVKDSQGLKLINSLRGIKCPNVKEQLFPIGKILWFVPKEAMDANDVRRRGNLMAMAMKNQNQNKREYKQYGDLSSVFATTWHNISKGIEEFQETMDESIYSTMKNNKNNKHSKYDGCNYILCDATNRRSIFQELVIDFPESLHSHMPNRYLWACDAHLTRGSHAK